MNYPDVYDELEELAELEEKRLSDRELQVRIYREKLKRERRTQRFVSTPDKPRPTIAQMDAEIKRISMGGVMCSMQRFDECRPANWPTAQDVVDYVGQSWEEIGKELGLRKRARQYLGLLH